MECYCKNPLLTAKDINENIQDDEKIQKIDNLVLTHVKDNIYTLVFESSREEPLKKLFEEIGDIRHNNVMNSHKINVMDYCWFK